MELDKSTRIDRGTFVSLGLILAVLAPGAIGITYLVRIDTKVNSLMIDKWGMTRQAEWVARMQIANPQMDFLDPRDPSKSLRNDRFTGGTP